MRAECSLEEGGAEEALLSALLARCEELQEGWCCSRPVLFCWAAPPACISCGEEEEGKLRLFMLCISAALFACQCVPLREKGVACKRAPFFRLDFLFVSLVGV